MELQIIDTLDGSSTSTDLFGLSRNIKTGLLNQVMDDGTVVQLGLITVHDLVRFSRTWAGWVNPEPVQEVSLCFELVDRWLEDPGSVTQEELEAAAWATEAVAGAAARAAGWAAEAIAGAAAGVVARAAGWAAAEGAAQAADRPTARADAQVVARAAARAAAEAAMHQRQGELVLETLASR